MFTTYMNLQHPKSIEDYIFNELQRGPVLTLDLVSTLTRSKNVTKQGVYKVLRMLQNENIVTSVKGVTSLHSQWLGSLAEFLQETQLNYKHAFEKNFFDIDEGDSIVYTFSNLKSADKFWAHIFNFYIDTLPQHESIYTYEAHNWFTFSSQLHSERMIAEKTHKQNIPYLATVGYNYPLDKIAKNNYPIPSTMQYFNLEKPIFDKLGYILSIFGEILVEVTYDDTTAEKIHNVFLKSKNLSDSVYEEIESIISGKSKIRFKISKNRRKTNLIKRKLQKHFWVKKI